MKSAKYMYVPLSTQLESPLVLCLGVPPERPATPKEWGGSHVLEVTFPEGPPELLPKVVTAHAPGEDGSSWCITRSALYQLLFLCLISNASTCFVSVGPYQLLQAHICFKPIVSAVATIVNRLSQRISDTFLYHFPCSVLCFTSPMLAHIAHHIVQSSPLSPSSCEFLLVLRPFLCSFTVCCHPSGRHRRHTSAQSHCNPSH